MSRSMFTQLFFCVPVVIIACSSPSGMPDARDVAGDAVTDVAPLCHTDIDCTDRVFCNGAERCMPGAVGANAIGCLPPSAPACASGQSCDETMMRCETDCGAAPDADHDGHRSIACGGDDCDDTDPNRFPGNPEVCLFDATIPTTMRVDPTHDEDCDPTTFANPTTHDGDHDGDGYVDHVCLNVDRNGMTNRGSDCADTAPVPASPMSLGTSRPPQNVHPTAVEVCNGVDDDCDGVIDNGDPGGGGVCGLTAPNVCRQGINHCAMGSITTEREYHALRFAARWGICA